MIKFKASPAPDCGEGHLFVSWCEVPGMIGISARNFEELRVKLEDEVARYAPEFNSKPISTYWIKDK